MPKVRAAAVSLIAGVAILALKLAAYFLTGSIALLSDAAESVVNVVAANIALISLLVSVRPPDADHQYGHAKAEYVSSATEATMIGIAGLVLIGTAVNRLIHPQPLERLPLGLGLLAASAAANLAVAMVLLRVSRAERSIALEASARHLLSDVWTSVGVFAGVVLVLVTGWTPLDPVAGIAVGANILWMGVAIYRRSVSGLLDVRLPPEDEGKIRAILDAHGDEIVEYHALRTRQAGPGRFLDLHLVLHRTLTVGQAHALTDDLERHIEESLPGSDVTIHVEPCERSCARCGTIERRRP
ncbi:MAG: cation diffusion facilitator family transporter [Armatimonadota bacterium]|nr:cation diffusion facilitator family transporter [Armatimonadota bacterium]